MPLPPAIHPRTPIWPPPGQPGPTKPAPEDCQPVDIEATNAWFTELAKDTPKGHTIEVTYEPGPAPRAARTGRVPRPRPLAWDGNPLPPESHEP